MKPGKTAEKRGGGKGAGGRAEPRRAATPNRAGRAAAATRAPRARALPARVPLLDLGRVHGPLEPELTGAFERVLRSGRFILGEEVTSFEREAASFLGVPHTVGMSSGTDALLAALQALDLAPGSEVLCPAFTFFSTAGSVWRTGLRPTFADVDPATFNAGIEELEAKVSRKTRALVVVHLFGRMVEMEPVMELARRRGLAVIEDAAQSFGAAGAGRRAGSFGDFGCFSFFPTKNLGGLGDGGLVSAGTAERAERLRVLRNLGQSTARYIHDEVSGNFRLDALQAALLRVKLPHVAAWNRRRRELADRYAALFADTGLAAPLGDGAEAGTRARGRGRAAASSVTGSPPVVVPSGAGERHVFHQYVVRILPPGARDRLRSHLEAVGIDTQIYYPLPLHLQPCFRSLGYREGDFPWSERLCREVLALPMHAGLTCAEQERVVTETARFFARPKRRGAARPAR